MICRDCGRMYAQVIPARCLCGATLDGEPLETLLRAPISPERQPSITDETTLPLIPSPEEAIPPSSPGETNPVRERPEAMIWPAWVIPPTIGDGTTRSTSPYDALIQTYPPPIPPSLRHSRFRRGSGALALACFIALGGATLLIAMTLAHRSPSQGSQQPSIGGGASPTATATNPPTATNEPPTPTIAPPSHGSDGSPSLIVPVAKPTATPTVIPTVAPTKIPLPTPTVIPPTSAPQPTNTPIVKPTATPNPTSTPTTIPTPAVTPTSTPSPTPTDIPSPSPTPEETVPPDPSPTETATSTSTPTIVPTATPADIATSTPSPTITPSPTPSVTPTPEIIGTPITAP